jgi:uncharacterized membrane protein
MDKGAMSVSVDAKNPVGTPGRKVTGSTRLPRTRYEALRFWMLAVASTALLETTVVAFGAAFPAASSHHDEMAEPTLRVLAVAAILPTLFLSLARFAEKKYQRRPPKALQAWQFGLYLAGTVLVSAGFLRHQANLDPSAPLLLAGELHLGAATILFAAWLASVLLCTPTEDFLTIP